MDLNYLGNQIKRLRKESNLTQQELSEKLNNNYNQKTDRSMISKWETGYQTPTITSLKSLADLFGVTLDYLNNRNDENESDTAYEISEINKTFSKRIKLRRNELGYSLVDLEKILNISNTVISNWEHGRIIPDVEKIITLADVLDCSIDYLLGRNNNPNYIKTDHPSKDEIDEMIEKKINKVLDERS